MRRPHVPLQLAVRPAAGRRDPAADREHGHEPRGRRGDGADQESLRWIGIDWDGPVTFQLDTAEQARELAQALTKGPRAYEDDGAIRFRQPKEGTVSWDDAVRGRSSSRTSCCRTSWSSLGRPSDLQPRVADRRHDRRHHACDRAEDHVSNTPSQINILRALGAELPVYAHLPNINGNDGKKLSKRRNDVSVDWFRDEGLPAAGADELPRAARLELRRQDDDHVAPRADRAFLPGESKSSPATFDFQKLDWMNGVYLRDLQPEEYALDLRRWLAEPRHRLAGRARERNRAAGAGEDREVLAVPRLRAVLLRRRLARWR
jgi:glutamyl/glutaminyl-tRNA synthetase